jgi:RNA polymerase sigma-70 factor (ECF subfamily)
MDFNNFYKSSKLRFYKFFLNRINNAVIAEDVTQDFFIKVYLNLDKFDDSKSLFDAWLFTIARNILIDHYRKNKYLYSSIKIDISTIDYPVEYSYSELLDVYNKEISKISKKKIDCFIMLQEGYSIKEIQEAFNISEGTVKSRIFNSREILKDKLKEFMI